MGNHSNKVWKELYLAEQQDTKEVCMQTLEKISTGQLNTQDQESIRAFTKKKQEELALKNKEIIEKLWAEYDTDKNGLLSRDECNKLTKDCILQGKKYIPMMLESVTTQQLNLIKSSMPLDVQQSFDKLMTKVSKTIDEGINKSLDKLLLDSDTISREIFQKMDENGDGNVTHSEFTTHYYTASAQLINNDDMISHLQQSVIRCVKVEISALLGNNKQ